MFQDDLKELLERMVIAYRAGDAQGCAACFSDDAVLLSPYAPPAQGRAAIEVLHRDWVGAGGNAKELSIIDSGSDGDLGWCLARFSEGEETGEGVSLSILVRDPRAGWLIRGCSLTAEAE